MTRRAASWVRTLDSLVPSRVGTAILLGAWLALTLAFAFVGNVFLLTVVTAMGQSLGPVSLALTVFGIFGTPAVSLLLARVAVATTVQRIDRLAVREPDATAIPDDDRYGTCGTNGRIDCRTPWCC